MFILYLIPVFMGAEIAIQSAVNSKLQSQAGSPYLASTISFFVGTLFLTILAFLTHLRFTITATTFLNNPWWMWVGGFTSAFALTSNILLFIHLGSIQTSVLPIVGQIIMSIIIDQFGFFKAPQSSLTLLKLGGLVILLGGALLSANIRLKKDPMAKKIPHHNNLPWQIMGIVAGALLAIQAAVNGYLGRVLHSSLLAALITCLVAFLCLLITSLVSRVQIIIGIKTVIQTKGSWWKWCGGFLGSSYVMISAQLVPILGTGAVIIIALFGQLTFSALIDNYGWLGAQQHPVSREQVIGLVLMLIGIVGVNWH